jgi:chromosome segregation protein
MFLKRLELQGFKTFAQKTALEFILDRDGRRGVTAVVGPNGSGKSNVADSLRWVMGEQSMKLLRGKKSEDVIFSGSDKRARSGFCEVTLTLQNDDRPEIEFSEIEITRRLYRDGNSEYEVNRKPARLQDVQLLLAQAGVGQRTYSVIGQGMIDQVLVASPSERKEFFDEAFGLRPFQLKRTSAMHKIEASKEHLVQTELLLQEIGPRVHTLEKQVKRLQERERLEEELRTLESQYYGGAWAELERHTKAVQDRLILARAEQEKREAEMQELLAELGRLEKDVPVQEGFGEIRKKIDELKTERAALRERQLHLETARAVAAVRAEKPWSPLPLSKIIESIEAVQTIHQKLEALLEGAAPDWNEVRAIVAELRVASQSLLGKLQRPAPEPTTEPKLDPEIEAEFLAIAEAMRLLGERIVASEQELDAWNRREQHERKQVFELQHSLNQKRQEAHQVERRVSEAEVERARLDTRREGLLEDLRRYAPALEESLASLSEIGTALPPEAAGRLQKLRSQLEWIGGIDPEVVKEYQETRTRHDFLQTQVEDVRAGLRALELVVKELDETIRERSQSSFARLNQEFGKFFKQLFQGGQGELLEMQAEAEIDEEGNPVEDAGEQGIAGIDIQVTPPGKRLKAIALLSGGERALTSIALICAIMATNPSPFVVLDEVDAALDESNSRKFGEIISSLADKTQFIVITHNRATMSHGNVLYGVTMGDDGVSQLLSVKLEDLEKWRLQKSPAA